MNPHMTISTFEQRGQTGHQRTWVLYNSNNGTLKRTGRTISNYLYHPFLHHKTAQQRGNVYLGKKEQTFAQEPNFKTISVKQQKQESHNAIIQVIIHQVSGLVLVPSAISKWQRNKHMFWFTLLWPASLCLTLQALRP